MTSGFRREDVSSFARRRRSSLGRRVLSIALKVRPIYAVASLVSSLRFVVQGDSMSPTLDQGQYLMASRMAYLKGAPLRGDLVVFRHPVQPRKDYIKRIIGLPREHLQVDDGQVWINDIPLEEPYVKGPGTSGHGSRMQWLLDDGEYFVLGDNRSDSQDSRSFGTKAALVNGMVQGS